MRLFGHTQVDEAAPRADAKPEAVQRREFVRVQASVPVSVTLQGGGERLELSSINLSGNGIVLARPEPGAPALEIGALVWLEITLDDGHEPIEARGSVVREGSRGAVGVRFDYIREPDQDRLVHFLFKQERRQLRTKEG